MYKECAMGWFGSELRGGLNPVMVCPHCLARGCVRTKPVDREKGLDGFKATVAVLTWGFSLFLLGLSRTESVTQAHCDHCTSTWDF